MKQIFQLLLLVLPFGLLAQDKGVHFEHGLTWQEVKAKAKAENKYIFMDCFTTWCGPCKQMTNNVFPLPEMGEYFNKNFINVKVQIDKTAGDNEDVKQWYEDAAAIAKDYKVIAYPTFLYFSPEGKLVHRVVGGGEAKAFIAKSSDALDPEKQYHTLIEKFAKLVKKEPADIRKIALAAQKAYERETAATYAKEYIATQKDLMTKENLEFVNSFTQSSKDQGFDLFLKQRDKVDALLGKGTASSTILRIITQEDIMPKVPRGAGESPDFEEMEAAIAKKYPTYSNEAVSRFKVQFYQTRKDFVNFQKEVTSYMSKYGAKVSAADLNSFARAVFENCPDMKCVGEALEWSKRSLEGKENPVFINTYANILYKMGEKDKAIAMQQKAIELASLDQQKVAYQATLDKMMKGEKTWTN